MKYTASYIEDDNLFCICCDMRSISNNKSNRIANKYGSFDIAVRENKLIYISSLCGIRNIVKSFKIKYPNLNHHKITIVCQS